MAFLTVVHLKSKNLRKKGKRLFHSLTILVFTFNSYLSWGQSLKLIKEIPTPPIKTVSMDLSGHVYIASEKGDVFKYNSSGEQIIHYSPIKPVEINVLEAWNPLRVFLFHADFQEYIFLDRFLTPSPSYTLNTEDSDFVNTATTSLDNNIWLIDITSFSLQKLDIDFNQLLINTPLELVLNPSDYDVNFIREYQNILFINDKKTGILIFDNLGNYIKTLKIPGIEYFSFQGNNLYFLHKGNIQLIDIYDPVLDVKEIALETGTAFKFVLLSKENAFLFTDNKMLIYAISE